MHFIFAKFYTPEWFVAEERDFHSTELELVVTLKRRGEVLNMLIHGHWHE